MSDWSTIDTAVNAIIQATFGESVGYQAVQAGVAVGDPVTIPAIRHVRERAEADAVAKVEEISVNLSDLPKSPQPGDCVTAWGLQFVVGPVRQPYGMVQLSLTLRAGQTRNS